MSLHFKRVGKTVVLGDQDWPPIVRDNAASDEWLDAIVLGLNNTTVVGLLKRHGPVGPSTDYDWINHLLGSLK